MLQLIKSPPGRSHRTFKSAWFTRAARKRRITDVALCKAVEEVRAGQAVNLGGGVWKKRLNENRDRAIILAQDGHHWFLVYLFMKKDRANISSGDEQKFRAMAQDYGRLSLAQLEQLLQLGEFVEICDGDSN